MLQHVGPAFMWPMDRPTFKLVALCYANHTNEFDECWPSRRTVAMICGCSISTVRNYLHELVELGVLVPIKRSKGGATKTSIYQFDVAAGNRAFGIFVRKKGQPLHVETPERARLDGPSYEIEGGPKEGATGQPVTRFKEAALARSGNRTEATGQSVTRSPATGQQNVGTGQRAALNRATGCAQPGNNACPQNERKRKETIGPCAASPSDDGAGPAATPSESTTLRRQWDSGPGRAIQRFLTTSDRDNLPRLLIVCACDQAGRWTVAFKPNRFGVEIWGQQLEQALRRAGGDHDVEIIALKDWHSRRAKALTAADHGAEP